MFKVIKATLRTVAVSVAAAAVRIFRGKAKGAVETFVQEELKRAAKYYVEVVVS